MTITRASKNKKYLQKLHPLEKLPIFCDFRFYVKIITIHQKYNVRFFQHEAVVGAVLQVGGLVGGVLQEEAVLVGGVQHSNESWAICYMDGTVV